VAILKKQLMTYDVNAAIFSLLGLAIAQIEVFCT
jgi:hypothetical protein